MADYLDRKDSKSPWRARLRVPKDLRAQFGPFVKQSLGTHNRCEAKPLALQCVVVWRMQFEEARGNSVRNRPTFWRALIAKTEEGSEDRALAIAGAEAAARDVAGFTALVDEDGQPEIFGNESPDELREMITSPPRPTEIQVAKIESFSRQVHDTKTDSLLDDWLDTMAGHSRSDLRGKHHHVMALTEKFPHVSQVRRKEVKIWVEETIKAGRWQKTTVTGMKSSWQAYWQFLADREIVTEDAAPFAFKLPRETGKEKSAREKMPWSPEDCVTIWNVATNGTRDAEGRQLKKPDPVLADYILINMFTGMRGVEIGKLRVQDVDGLNGNMPTLTIEDAKTPAGNRVVPIHSKLVDTIRRLVGGRTTGFLVEHASPKGAREEDRHVNVTQRAGLVYRKLRDQGKVNGERRDYHSFRRTVCDMLKDFDIPEHVAAAIVGHEHDTMTFGKYAGDVKVEKLVPVVEMIAYPFD